MKKKTYLLSCLLFLTLNSYIINAQSTNRELGKNVEDYNPRYWVQGAFHSRHTDKGTETAVQEIINHVYTKGWGGVIYWGASRSGEKMNYYYKSPFLEKQSWAVFKRDGLSPIIKEAHKKRLKVILIVGSTHDFLINPHV